MRVAGFYDENSGYLEELTLTKHIGKHSICRFRVNLTQIAGMALTEKIGTSVAVYTETINDERPVFFGIISEVFVECNFAASYAEVTVVSATANESDEVSYKRIFQNPHKSIGDVANEQKLQMTNCQLRLADNLSRVKYKDILLQNNETNFAFLHRIADYSDLPLWVIDTKEGKAEIVIDDSISDVGQIVNENDIVSLRLGRDKNCKIAYLVTDKYYRFGTTLVFAQSSRKYLVIGWELRLIKGSEQFSYELREYKPKTKIDFVCMPTQETIKLTGTITDNNDPLYRGRVKVDFTPEYVDDRDEEKSWIPWRTPYGGKNNGIIFLPDKGSKVEAFFINGECFVASIIRDNEIIEEARNVTHKYIGNDTKQRIFWKEKSLEIMSADSRILLDKDKIELMVGQAKICVNKDEILIANHQCEIKLSPQGMESKTIGELHFKSEKNVVITSEADLSIHSGSNMNINSGSKLMIQSIGKTNFTSNDKIQIVGTKVELG